MAWEGHNKLRASERRGAWCKCTWAEQEGWHGKRAEELDASKGQEINYYEMKVE